MGQSTTGKRAMTMLAEVKRAEATLAKQEGERRRRLVATLKRVARLVERGEVERSWSELTDSGRRELENALGTLEAWSRPESKARRSTRELFLEAERASKIRRLVKQLRAADAGKAA